MADALVLPCTIASLATALGLSPAQILNIYVGGSRLWQTSSPQSDYDIYVIHAQKDAALRLKTLSVTIAGAKFDATIMHRDEWADRLRRHKPVDVAVTAFHPRPAQQKLTPAQAGFTLSRERLCDSHTEHTAREWARVRKYVEHGDLEMAKKTLVCLVRQLHIAQQLLVGGSGPLRLDFAAANEFRELLFCVHERSLEHWEAEYGARVEAMRAGLRRREHDT
jgi:hypothetical protein